MQGVTFRDLSIGREQYKYWEETGEERVKTPPNTIIINITRYNYIRDEKKINLN